MKKNSELEEEKINPRKSLLELAETSILLSSYNDLISIQVIKSDTKF
jgi:hypothetical protein